MDQHILFLFIKKSIILIVFVLGIGFGCRIVGCVDKGYRLLNDIRL